ncbi:MAG: EAL domain-containing protein [Gammaproteobacteria bacterium]|nr:MAG: EAL domain-containing protein [Gammaproteobacteria bacterium]
MKPPLIKSLTRDHSPLSLRMLGYILLASSVFTLLATGIQVYSDYRSDVSLVESRMNLIETSYREPLARSLWSLDQKLMRVQLEGIHNLPDIVHLYLQIYPDQEVELGEIPGQAPTLQHTIELSYSTEDERFDLGKLTITASLEHIYASLRERIMIILGTQALKTFILSFFILWLFQYLVTRHITHIAGYAEKLNLNRLDQPLVLNRKPSRGEPDELERLQEALNRMRVTLKREIEKQQQDAAEIRKLSQAIEQSPSSVLICNRDWRIVYANRKFTEITHYELNELLNRHPKELTPLSQDSVDNESQWRNIENQVERTGKWQGEMHSTRKGGERFWEQVVITPIREEGDTATRHYLIMGEDISVRKRYEQQLLRQANYDLLTGLPNRLLALDRLKLALTQAKRDNNRVGIMFLDLDNFKTINDTLGHDAGDTLLIEASRRISGSLRGSSTVSRLGGDEFLIILPNLDDATGAERVAERILNAFRPAFSLGGQDVFVSTSIGIALFPDDSDNSSALLQHADAAMYQAKNKGKSAYHRYTPDIHETSHERLKLETLLRKALNRNELLLHYQPIVELPSRRITRVEALIRWDNPEHGLIPPDKFIPLAEESGVIISIGAWVIHTACRAARRWREVTGEDLAIAINVSPRQFRDPGFVDTVRAALNEHELPGSSLELEITERLLLDDSIETQSILRALDEMGVKLSVDDFGTGYSALSYLKSYPFDTLKIDRSFINDITVEEEDEALVNAIITMAHSLGLDVIAEGVEDESQLAFLIEKGCDMAQGYFFSRPMPPEDLLEWAQKNLNVPVS